MHAIFQQKITASVIALCKHLTFGGVKGVG